MVKTLLFALLAALPSAASAQTDADFLAAKDAFDHGDRRKLDALAPALAGHILAPYVAYWQLKGGIDGADYGAVRAFLTRNANTPLADRLAIDWLKSLAKRGDWTRFALDYPPVAGEDVELTCYGIQYRRQRDGDAALGAAKSLWATGQATPDACEPLFQALFAKGDLAEADWRLRFRMAVESGNLGLAHAIAADFSAKEKITPRELAAIDKDALRALTQGAFTWKSAAGQDLALFALERAARRDAAGARAAWLQWRDRLPAAARDYGNARVAYHGARQLLPAANAWFRDVPDAMLTPEQQAWRVRAALRVSAWPDVRAAIDRLPERDQQEAAWRYWKARALATSGDRAAADALYATLAGDLNFYGLLAAEAQGRGAEQLLLLKSDPRAPTVEALATLGARPEVRRVLKLAELDMRPESLREWIYVVRGLDDDALLLAAEYARRSGLYDRAINTAERTVARHDFGLRYLMPFRDEFSAASRDQGVDEDLLYGIARQESRFVPDIVSAAGARGLMQLMPGTARWVAKQMARSDFSPDHVTKADLNTQFGAYYFKYWQDRLDGRPALAAAAYNAGPGRAQAWRPSTIPLEGAIWVETIPFNETRDYVKKVLANAMIYTHALNRPYASLGARLGTIAPRGAIAGSAGAATPAQPE
ncbi:MAG: transglycosylase SLT domain-containing protein [Betaproteobacteria bacterium]